MLEKETGKPTDDSHYRPIVQLDCVLSQYLANQELITPMVIADVGARGGFDTIWDVLGSKVAQIGFEADASAVEESAEVAGGIETLPGGTNNLIACALWRSRGRKTLYVTRERSASSLFKPNMRFFNRLPDPTMMDILETVEVPTISLDELNGSIGSSIDVLKLDVHGAELEILYGAERQIAEEVLAIVVETMFEPQWEGQPPFHEVDRYMRSKGFALIDLDIRRWRRRPLPALFDSIRVGPVAYADAVYLKDPLENPEQFCAQGKERDKYLKLASIGEVFSVIDYSIEVLETAHLNGIIEKEELDSFVGRINSNVIVSRHDRTIKPNRSADRTES